MFNKHENVRSYCSDNKNEKKVLLYLINYGLEPIGLIQINGWIDRLLYNESYVKSCQVVTCDLPCDLPCAASLAGIQPVRPRAQRTSP